MKKKLLFIFLLFIEHVNAQISITSFAPTSGFAGSTVIINGANFNTTPSSNIVFFGTAIANITAATANSLTVTVPFGATYQYISVTDITSHLTAYSLQPFIVKFACGGAITSTSYATKLDSLCGIAPQSIAIGDLDGDGNLDVVTANNNSNTVSVLRNTSSGAISFATKIDFATGTNPFKVVLGDLDGDGKLDIVVTNSGANTVSVLKNISTSGTILFASKVDFATGTNPHGVSIGDIDKDGKPDLAITNYSSNTVSVLQNISTSGTISFAAKVDYVTGSGPCSVAINDLDGDGNLELAVVNYSSHAVSVFRSTGSGSISFAAKVDFGVSAGPIDIAIGDLSGDGLPDIAVPNNASGVSLLKNSSSVGTISFVANVDFNVMSNPMSVALADIDGDGWLDIAVANSYNNNVSLLKNTSHNGYFYFNANVNITTGTTPYGVVVGDIDRDGRPDILTANNASNTISILKNQIVTPSPVMTSISTTTISNGGTAIINLVANPASTFNWIAADNINTTGESLTLQTTSTLSNTINNNTNTVQTVIYTVTPTSTIGSCVGTSQTVTITIDPSPTISSISPLSGPVGTNVIITGTNFNPTLSNNLVFFGNTKATILGGSITTLTATVPSGASYNNISVTDITTNLTAWFSQPFNVTYTCGDTIRPNSFNSSSSYCGTNLGGNAAVADLDGDGKSDIVVVNSNVLATFKNKSTGAGVISFGPRVDFTSQNIDCLAIADFDGDGKPDVVTTFENQGYSSTIAVNRNISTIGTISLTASGTSFGTALGPTSIIISDVNADGKLDLVVPNDMSGSISVFNNTSTLGSISFAQRVDYTVGAQTYNAAVGDIDGDGKPEIIASNSGSNTISILRNTCSVGLISFSPKVDFAITQPWGIAIADINADGKLDICVANQGNNSISVFKNTSTIGAISLAPNINFIAGTTQPTGITAGDIDGDGKLDLTVTKSNTSSSVSILKNTSAGGTISFASKVDLLGTSPNPYALSIGDLDGDGKPDLITPQVNSTSSSVTIFRNNILGPTLTVNTPTICAGSSATLTANGATTYTWSTGANGSTITPSPTTNTTYTVTGTTGSCVSRSITTTVTVKNQLTAAPSYNNICQGTGTNLMASGATTYSWNTGATAATIGVYPTVTTTYTVTGTTGTCSLSKAITVTVNPAPGISFSGSNFQKVCSGDSVAGIIFNVTPIGTTVYWTNNNTAIGLAASNSGNIAGFSAPIETVQKTGVVTATATISATGCHNSTTYSITINPLPSVTVNSPTICTGATVLVTAGGANTYTWNTGLIGNTITPSPNITTNYTVTGTDINNCKNKATSTVTVNNTFTAPIITVNSSTICAGVTATLTANGANTYTWSTAENGAIIIHSPTITTNYIVTGTDANNCTNIVNATITVNPLPVVTINSPTICTGATTTLTASGANTYLWNTNDTGNIITPSPITTTNYTVTGTDINGCVNSSSSAITVNALPVISVNSSTICAGESYTITPSGANTYIYSGGNQIVSPITQTIYTVTGIDNNGCIGSINDTINVNQLPTLTTTNGTVCAGQSYTLAASGANTYTYSSGSQIVSPTTQTIYTITGTDNNGCVGSVNDTVTVNSVPATPTLTGITDTSNTMCQGNTYSLTVNSYSSTAVWYSLNYGTVVGLGSYYLPPINMPPGIYSYSVIDSAFTSCKSAGTQTLTVTIYPTPTITINSMYTICAGITSTICASGANTYTWFPPSQINYIGTCINANTPGNYTVQGTDSNGCTSNVTSTIVQVVSNPTVTINVAAVNCNSLCENFTGTVSSSTVSTYVWDFGDASPPSTSTNAMHCYGNPLTTVASLTVTDANGCVGTATANVVVNPIPGAITVSVSSNTICAGANVVITPSGANTYSLFPSNQVSSTNFSLTPTSNVTYTIVGSNNVAGCADTATTIITVKPLPTVSFSLTQDATPHIWDAYPTYSSNTQSAIWYWGDGDSTIALYPSHNFATPNNYYVCVTAIDTVGCAANYCINDSLYRMTNNTIVTINVINSASGIQNYVQQNINLYPNPNNGTFIIETNNPAKQIIQIFDVNGRLVLTQTITGKIIINASDLINGVYNINISSSEGVVNKRLVITR